MKPRYKDVKQRALVLGSDRDLLIPSAEEAERLGKELPRARSRVLQNRSHAPLMEAGVDLYNIMQVGRAVGCVCAVHMPSEVLCLSTWLTCSCALQTSSWCCHVVLLDSTNEGQACCIRLCHSATPDLVSLSGTAVCSKPGPHWWNLSPDQGVVEWHSHMQQAWPSLVGFLNTTPASSCSAWAS
jgi:hypothetical protein